MYIELHAQSAFSFLEGASVPEELAAVCMEHGMAAMALLDRDGVYGSPRFHYGMKKAGLKAHIGSEITFATQNYRGAENLKIENFKISNFKSSLSPCLRDDPAVRLGLRYVRGLREDAARALLRERNKRPFDSITDLARRVPELRKPELTMLAQVGALNSLGQPNSTRRHGDTEEFEISNLQIVNFKSSNAFSPASLPQRSPASA